jgi:hypothetical protein
LHGLGGAFFILLLDPTSPVGSVLDVDRPCVLDVGWGISAICLPGDGAIVAFGDCTPPSSSSTSMVSTSELTVVVSADTADLVRFPLLFFASATWVAAWEAGIFPAACRVRRGAATLDGALRDATGASVVTPHRRVRDVLVDGRRWRRLYIHHITDLVAALVLVTKRRRAPVDALAVLNTQTAETPSEPRCVLTKTQIGKTLRDRKLTGSEGLYTPSALGHSLLRIRPSKMFFA